MKIIILLNFLFISFSLHANSSITDHLPALNTENEVFMGDKMVEQRTGYFLECIVPNFDVNYVDAIGSIIIIKKDAINF